MTFRSAPSAASWFLNQFGSLPENESVIGDLTEQYQRGRGSIWYWRQVLSIIFGGLYREFRGNKRSFVVGLFHTWCIWGGLQIAAGILLLTRFVWLHPEQLQYGISVQGFPLLALQAKLRSPYSEQVEILLLSLLLSGLTLLAVGNCCARVTKLQPRTMLLAFITTFVVADAGWMVAGLLVMVQNPTSDMGFLVIRELIALLFVPALLLIGGMRGLSVNRLQLKGGEA